jgi:hypothetical protein
MSTSPMQLLQHKNNTYKHMSNAHQSMAAPAAQKNTYKHMSNAHQSTVAPAAQKQHIQAHV